MPPSEQEPYRYSIVVPVYGNEGSIEPLVTRLEGLADGLDGRLEVVFVVDGSPDESEARLREILPTATIASQLLAHSRNFGAFQAIRTGLVAARGQLVGVMAADLQEPPELMATFFAELGSGRADIAVGRREARDDPGVSSTMSRVYWGLYRRWVVPDLPPGGVDVFAVNRRVADEIIALRESHTSLVGLLYWVGFRRVEVPYGRSAREHGTSGWTFRKKLRYLLDSVFAFTDLPINFLTGVGTVGAVLTVLAGLGLLVARATGSIDSAGYTPIMLTILFSTFVLLLGLGVVGSYVWRIYENSKQRPHAIATLVERHDRAAR